MNLKKKIVIGNEVHLLDYASFGRYSEKINVAELSYTSNPKFDYNKKGVYRVTFSVTYLEKQYTNTINVTVKQ